MAFIDNPDVVGRILRQLNRWSRPKAGQAGGREAGDSKT